MQINRHNIIKFNAISTTISIIYIFEGIYADLKKMDLGSY